MVVLTGSVGLELLYWYFDDVFFYWYSESSWGKNMYTWSKHTLYGRKGVLKISRSATPLPSFYHTWSAPPLNSSLNSVSVHVASCSGPTPFSFLVVYHQSQCTVPCSESTGCSWSVFDFFFNIFSFYSGWEFTSRILVQELPVITDRYNIQFI